MKREAIDELNLEIRLEDATVPVNPHWPTSQKVPDDDLDVHVGRHYEMHTPRRQRPHQEPGLVVGKNLAQC